MDTDEKSRLVIVVGSVREGRFGPTVASWVADRAREHGGFDVGVVDLVARMSRFPCRPRPRSSPGTTTPGQRA